MNLFKAKLKTLHQNSMKQRKQYNLTPFERNLLRKLKENEDLKVVMIDKNMGTGLMPKSLYIQRAWSDHLSNSMTYREISAGAIPAEIGRIKYLVDTFLSKCHKELPNHERVFLRRLRAEFYTSLISKFYIMPKLTKHRGRQGRLFQPVVLFFMESQDGHTITYGS